MLKNGFFGNVLYMRDSRCSNTRQIVLKSEKDHHFHPYSLLRIVFVQSAL